MKSDQDIRHIGLFGGSYDPVHTGHLLAAASVQTQLMLDEVVFLPAARSPFKPSPITSDQDRLAMLKLALRPSPDFKLDTRELQQPGPSYSIDTLRSILAEQPQHHYYLIIGMDAWKSFENWHEWQKIIARCHLVVVTRPGYEAGPLSDEWEQRRLASVDQIRQLKAGKVLFVAVPASSAASSKIRARIRNHQVTGDALTAEVWRYIQDRALYQ